MSDLAFNSSQHDTYERRSEYDRIVNTVVTNRQNLLIYGERHSGKTRLLRQFASAEPRAAYISLASSVRDVLLNLLRSTAGDGNAKSTTSAPKTSSVIALQGLLDERLAREGWILVLDHVDSPSANVSKLIKTLHDYGRTPILFAARSPHMEDIGNFRSLCYERSSRLELKPWPPALALEFARREANSLHLSAANLEEALRGIAELSAGYPGTIADMLRMAAKGKYSRDGTIKFRTLYLDYIMSGC